MVCPLSLISPVVPVCLLYSSLASHTPDVLSSTCQNAKLLHSLLHTTSRLLLAPAELQGKFRRKGVRVNNWDHLMSWLAPAQRGSHMPWWTFIFAAAVLVIFFFMAGPQRLLLLSAHVVSLKVVWRRRAVQRLLTLLGASMYLNTLKHH